MRWIYLIGPEGGPIKVGSATNLKGRLSSIQTGHPAKLLVHASWQHEFAYEVERKTHDLLAEKRLFGEWFNASVAEAIAAVEQAIRSVDGLEEPPPDPEPPVEPVEEGLALFEEALVPVAEMLPDEQHRLGYARHTRHTSADTQIKWMLRSGVDLRDVYVEDDGKDRSQWQAALKDFREGDTLLIWSAEVIAPATLPLELQEIAARKGGKVAFANGVLV